MKKYLFVLVIGMIYSSFAFADEYDDDIYYNPKKEKKEKSQNPNTEINLVNGRDVDEYNRFGGYYESDIDTIGVTVGNGEDFVYTKQIQKYYNPTIVVDNADVFDEVMNSSYGNVDIVINAGVPTISTWYTPYYYSVWGSSWNYWNSWVWGPSWTWSYSWYNPWYNPCYTPWYDPWYDPWYPGWGPSWHPGPHPGHHPSGGHHHADWNPNGHRSNRPNDGWANNTRPNNHRPSGNVGSHRYNNNTSGHRMTNGKGYRVDNNGFRENATIQHRNTNTTVKSNDSKNRGTSVNRNNNKVNNTNRNSNLQRSTTNSTRNNSTMKSGNNSHRGNSGSFGGSRSNNRGGGSRGSGRHR